MTTADYLEQLQQDKSDLVDNLTTKGITGLTGNETFTELVPEVLNIPSGGGGTTEAEYKDVNFYDYDGARVYSYTKTEFLQLNAMPENPSHDGLTSQGWNWSLSDAQTFVTNNDKLDIAQHYVTNDGKTRIYIELQEGRTSPYCGFALNGTVTIDWGDNTTSTVTGTGTGNSGIVNTQHNYAKSGKYVISISNETKIYIRGKGSMTNLLWNNNTSDVLYNYIYLNAIKKVELGNNVEISENCFRQARCLETVTIPNNLTGSSGGWFSSDNSLKFILIKDTSSTTRINMIDCVSLKNIVFSNFESNKQIEMSNCYSLQKIVMPKVDFSTSGTSAFANCTNLKYITISNNITTLQTNAFNFCYSISNIKIPNSITAIPNGAFSNCTGAKYFDFSTHTAVPTLGTSVFPTSYINDFKIIVPDSLYDTWIATSGWSSVSSYIISKSDWDALQ
jgi:hypothetical protein